MDVQARTFGLLLVGIKNLEVKFMYRIAICDDSKYDLDQTYRMVSQYSEKNGLDLEIRTFSSAMELESTEKSGECFDIYILDIIMEKVDGIELGKRIRAANKKAVIIYTTNSREFALESYSVKAFAYLVKPISETELSSEFDQIWEHLKNNIEQKIKIKFTTGTEIIPINDIISVEYRSRRMTYNLADGRSMDGFSKRESFETLCAPLLNLGCFLKVSASHIINMNHVKSMTAKEFIMSDDTSFSVTRTYRSAKKTYFDFVFEDANVIGG